MIFSAVIALATLTPSFSELVNPIDDSVRWVASYADGPASIVGSCSAANPENVQILFKPGRVLYEGRVRSSGYYERISPVRLDKNEAVPMRFYVERDSATLVGRGTAGQVIEHLAGGGEIAVELAAYDQKPIFMRLPAGVARGEFAALAEKCIPK